MALIEIDDLPSEVNINGPFINGFSMANCECHKQMVNSHRFHGWTLYFGLVPWEPQHDAPMRWFGRRLKRRHVLRPDDPERCRKGHGNFGALLGALYCIHTGIHLVGALEHILWLSRNTWEFHHHWRVVIFFRGVGQPPTRYIMYTIYI